MIIKPDTKSVRNRILVDVRDFELDRDHLYPILAAQALEDDLLLCGSYLTLIESGQMA